MDSNIKSGVHKYYLNCVFRTDKHGKPLETKNGNNYLDVKLDLIDSDGVVNLTNKRYKAYGS